MENSKIDKTPQLRVNTYSGLKLSLIKLAMPEIITPIIHKIIDSSFIECIETKLKELFSFDIKIEQTEIFYEIIDDTEPCRSYEISFEENGEKKTTSFIIDTKSNLKTKN